MNIRTILVGAFVVVIAFIGASALLNMLWPSAATLQQGRPALVAVPPLQPLTGTSTVLAPAAIALTAIRDALDAQAPRNLVRQAAKSGLAVLTNADLNFDIARGPLTVSGRPDALIVATPLTGQFRASGTIASGANSVSNALGNLVGGSVGQAVQNLAGKAFDQHADIQGTVTTTSKPTIAPNWRLAPNLSAQVNVVDVISADRRPETQRRQPGEAVPRQCGAQPDRRLGNAAAQRSVHRERGARRMGQAMPRHSRSARQGRACRISGSKCARPAPSLRSRRSTPTR